ncbi:sugar ABC transporter permease [Acidipropionibacterium jensenii]|uniref:sugar ABC transporter permease n=1 Tax=Acidipropionibacterium jensenii TaxID=1749 RepID=UPI00214C9C5A|nr:ABC transporter permease subunit [Acidipropionibacterium jensenii]
MSTAALNPPTETGAPRQSRSRGPRGRGLWWRYVVAVAACVFAVFPILYVLSASLNPSGTMTGSNSLFTTISGSNYVKLFANPERPYGRWYLNTTLLAVSVSLLTVLFSALAAYAFSRLRFRGRRGGLLSLMLIQMFPQMLAVTAIFLLLSNLGDVVPVLGIGSLLALAAVYLGGALGANTYLMYGFFNSVPRAVDEAAQIDGAGHARTFFTIILPLVIPTLAVVGLLSFINTFNEYVVASVVVGNDPATQTLALGLYQYVSEQTNSNWPVFAAGTVLACLPPLVVFFWLQKYLVSGLTSGSVK